MSKKGKIIIAILIIIVLVVGFFIIRNRNSKFNYQLTNITIDEVKYFTLRKNENYGVIDKEGKTVVEPKYQKVVIPNPTKAIFIVTDSNEPDKSFAIDKTGTKVLTQYEDIEAISINQTSSYVPYEKDVLKYKANGLYGLIDFNGNKITNAEYEEIEGIDYKEGMLQVKKDAKYGAINIKGATVIECKYDEIEADGYYNVNNKYDSAGFIVRTKTDDGYKYGYFNKEGKKYLDTIYNDVTRINKITDEKNVYLINALNGRYGLQKNNKAVIENDFDAIEFNESNKLLVVSKEDAYGVYDLDGNLLLPLDYDSVLIGGIRIVATKGTETLIFNNKGDKIESEFTSYTKGNDNNAVVIDVDGNYNIVDKNEKKLLDKNYDYIEYFTNDYYIVNLETKSGIIKSNGEVVVDINYSYIQKINDSNCLEAGTEDGTTYIISTSCDVSEGIKDAQTVTYENYIKLYSGTDASYFDLNGKKVTYQSLYPNKTLYAKKENGKWGFTDKSGNMVVECKYDMVTEQGENSCGVKVGEKWGVIDTSGNVIVEPTYTIYWNNIEFRGQYYKTLENIGLSTYSDDENA